MSIEHGGSESNTEGNLQPEAKQNIPSLLLQTRGFGELDNFPS